MEIPVESVSIKQVRESCDGEGVKLLYEAAMRLKVSTNKIPGKPYPYIILDSREAVQLMHHLIGNPPVVSSETLSRTHEFINKYPLMMLILDVSHIHKQSAKST